MGFLASRFSIGVIAALVSVSCVPKHPKKTARPNIVVAAPFEERTVLSQSGHAYKYLFAPGPTETSPNLVLLPGGIFDNRIWLYVGGLARHFNVYALDWPNNSLFYTGRSSDFGDIARDFLKTLSLEDTILMGVSMGTFAAIDVAVKQADPYNIRGLILISTVMFGVSEAEIKRRKQFSRLALKFSPEKLRSFVEWRTTGNDYDQAPGKIQQLDIFWTRPYVYYYQVFSMTHNQGSKRQDTDSITCPVLLLHGTEDEIMDIEVARLNPTRFKNAKWIELEGLKHSMVFSHGPLVVTTIENFLKTNGLLP